MLRFCLLVLSGLACGFAQPSLDLPQYSGLIAEERPFYQEALQSQTPLVKEQASFALGFLSALEAIETLGQAWYRHGLTSEIGSGLFFNLSLDLPTPENPNPEPISYQDLRGILEEVNQHLRSTDAYLAMVSDPEVSLTVNTSALGLDINADDTLSQAEQLGVAFSQLNRVGNLTADLPEALIFRFDLGDAHWLRGYANLWLAVFEVILAHDSSELFNVSAHIFFPKAVSPYQEILAHTGMIQGMPVANEVDLLTLLHMIMRVPLYEPERLKTALAHALIVTEQSEQMWEAILAEQDDDLEWIPNPAQTGVLPAQVTQAMIDDWLYFVKEVKSMWQGDKLIPHWRLPEGMGINIKRVFEKPVTFDVVLWAQGSYALLYAEEGTMIDTGVFEQLQDTFGNQIFGFAAWFN